jgi:hypothetical protein
MQQGIESDTCEIGPMSDLEAPVFHFQQQLLNHLKGAETVS